MMNSNNKYEFILQLIEKEKLNSLQKEQVIKLATKEFGKDHVFLQELDKRLMLLEQQIGTGAPEEEPPSGKNKPDYELKDYWASSYQYRFLRAFNRDDILKSTCHLIDNNELKSINKVCETEEYDFNAHYQKVCDRYNELENEHTNVYNNLKTRFRVYLTGKNYYNEQIKNWGRTDNTEFNWSNDIIAQWVSANKNCPPNADPGLRKNQYGNPKPLSFEKVMRSKVIPESGKNDSGYRISNFPEFVLYFKFLFHIRQDNSLFNILKFQNKLNNWDEKIEFQINQSSFPTNIEFFTDVDKLVNAYKVIIGLIIEMAKEEKPIVELKLTEFDDRVELSIHHVNSIYGKSILNQIDSIGQNHKNLINNQINGLCDLYIQADFGNGNYARINLWDKAFMRNGPKKRISEKLDYFKGVEHLLVFLK